MLGLPWWLWIVFGYAASMGIAAFHDRWVRLWKLWVLPIMVIGIKSQNVLTWPLMMSVGGTVGGVLGLWYAYAVNLQWSKQRPGWIWIPGGWGTFGVMMSFILCKIILGFCLANGLLDPTVWKPVDIGVGAVFTGYNGAKVSYWTWWYWKQGGRL